MSSFISSYTLDKADKSSWVWQVGETGKVKKKDISIHILTEGYIRFEADRIKKQKLYINNDYISKDRTAAVDGMFHYVTLRYSIVF